MPDVTSDAPTGSESMALGLALRLTTTEAGGRQTPLLGGSAAEVRFRYRPNWGLPGMEPPEQSGAPVLAFSKETTEPGDEVRAVIVPLFPQMLGEWRKVRVGDVLPMYEGHRVCGHGRVMWVRALPEGIREQDETTFRHWVSGPSDVLEP